MLKNCPTLVLAPHLSFPTHRGDDILIAKKWSNFSIFVPYVDIVGLNTINRYQQGVLVSSTPFANQARSKSLAGCLTLLNHSHYLKEKLLTPRFIAQAQQFLNQPQYQIVVFSYLFTATMAGHRKKSPSRCTIIETHNNEFVWYENLKQGTRNPVARQIAEASKQWARWFMTHHSSNFFFFHISEKDQQEYLALFPNHQSAVIPAGVDPATNLHFAKRPAAKLRLAFVGSLGNTMNADALRHLADRYYPVLKNGLPNRVEMVIAGSTPSKKIVRLCQNMKWLLYPDLSHQDLGRLLSTITFAVLPFTYTTGAKLKLLHYLSHGIPVVGTEMMAIPELVKNTLCLFSDRPADWLHHLKLYQTRTMPATARHRLIAYANKYSWDKIANRMRLIFSQIIPDGKFPGAL